MASGLPEFAEIPVANRPRRTFYFLRHGETEFNHAGRFQGRIDVPLNDRGLQQAEEAAERLTAFGISRIVASPAQRALQTAGAVAELSAASIDVDDDLMEFQVGSFEGKSHEAIRQEHGLGKSDSLFDVLPDDADVWHEFVPRVVSSVRRWTEKYESHTVLIAAHGLVFRSLAQALAGKKVISCNAEPFRFALEEKRFRVERV
jgi:broad specificity phosphatase PhoE